MRACDLLLPSLLLIALSAVKDASSVTVPVLSVQLPSEMEQCTQRCQCWYPRDKSMDLLRQSTCRKICDNSNTDYTRPCFDWQRCHVSSKSNCSLICSASPYNCIAMDFDMSDKRNFAEILVYTAIGIVIVACIAAAIVYAVKRSKLVNRL